MKQEVAPESRRAEVWIEQWDKMRVTGISKVGAFWGEDDVGGRTDEGLGVPRGVPCCFTGLGRFPVQKLRKRVQDHC